MKIKVNYIDDREKLIMKKVHDLREDGWHAMIVNYGGRHLPF